jgi:hypothetical protein
MAAAKYPGRFASAKGSQLAGAGHVLGSDVVDRELIESCEFCGLPLASGLYGIALIGLFYYHGDTDS